MWPCVLILPDEIRRHCMFFTLIPFPDFGDAIIPYSFVMVLIFQLEKTSMASYLMCYRQYTPSRQSVN